MIEIYDLIQPTTTKVPILISVPHSGYLFPENLKDKYHQGIIGFPEDTDWYVDKLYDFANSLGITLIKAKYSRWVIDLNRNVSNEALYQDGRVITDVVTKTNFLGQEIYKDGYFPNTEEINSRVELYYQPYHQKINDILLSFKKDFGIALLYDAHSIKKNVPSIRKEAFPDLILGTNQEKSASSQLIKVAVEHLSNQSYSFSHNTPFQGGAITRKFGKPAENIHAIQLERAKNIYMDDSETIYAPSRASKLKDILKAMFMGFIEVLDINIKK